MPVFGPRHAPLLSWLRDVIDACSLKNQSHEQLAGAVRCLSLDKLNVKKPKLKPDQQTQAQQLLGSSSNRMESEFHDLPH